MKGKNSEFVAHPVFGEGVVVATRWDEEETQVKFRSGLCLWLPSKWLKQIPASDINLDRVSCKRLLEAFRLGVVPHQDIEYFTFGRAYEINEIKQSLRGLKNGKGDVFLIEGSYGSGKTHLLEYARHLSLKQGYVTTYCELSTQETPLFRPKRVYRELIHNLRYIRKGREYCFRDLLRMVSRFKIDDHCFFTPLLKKIKEIDHGSLESEVFWQWVEGESTKNYAVTPDAPFRIRGAQKIPALYDFSTAGDFYSYLLTGLSFLINRAGLGGLVIILDEVETITHIWNYAAYSRGLSFLEGLIHAAFDTKTFKRIDTHLVHNQVRPTPYLYKESHIFLILAMTPVQGIRSIENVINLIKKGFFLRRFSKAEYEVIFDNLIKVYRCAYPWFSLDRGQRENIFSAALHRGEGELREFIKFSVEAFDWLRLKR